MGDDGTADAIFERSLKNGNLIMAEATARELSHISLGDALELTALIAAKDPHRADRASGRWLRFYLGAAQPATLRDAATVVGCLSAFGGPEHAQALATLRAMAKRAEMRAV